MANYDPQVVAAAQRLLSSLQKSPTYVNPLATRLSRLTQNPLPIRSFFPAPPLAPDPIRSAFERLQHNLELNPSFEEKIQQNHTAVRDYLENNGLAARTKLIGSLQRKTRKRPREGDDFDIDILVEMGSFFGWTYQPGQGVSTAMALGRLQRGLAHSDRYGAMRPQQDRPIVLFSYKDGVKVELVPAYKDKVGYGPDGIPVKPYSHCYWVPTDHGWEAADYDYDGWYIIQQNKKSDGWLIPTIKMLKAIMREKFNGYMLSFHMEILAALQIPIYVALRKSVGLSITYPYLIESFFGDAHRYLTLPIRIPGSNSPPVKTDYPYTLKEKFQNITLHCRLIKFITSREGKLQAWNELFGDAFTLHDGT